jgi:hypothetical protein
MEVLGILTDVPAHDRHHAEFHDLASRVGICCWKVGPRYAAPKWLIRSLVDEEDLGTNRQPGEVDDDVGPFGRRHEELVELHRLW